MKKASMSLKHLHLLKLSPTLLKLELRRYIRANMIGVFIFGIDLGIVWFLTDVMHVYYILSLALVFLIIVNIAYFAKSRFVFKHSSKSAPASYTSFFLVFFLGLLLTLGFMSLLVDLGGMYHLYARLIVSTVVGLISYLINLVYNFGVLGVPL